MRFCVSRGRPAPAPASPTCWTLTHNACSEGYLLLRAALPREAVLAAQRTIVAGLIDHGWGFEDADALTLADDHPRPCAWCNLKSKLPSIPVCCTARVERCVWLTAAQGGSSAVGRPFGGGELQVVMQVRPFPARFPLIYRSFPAHFVLISRLFPRVVCSHFCSSFGQSPEVMQVAEGEEISEIFHRIFGEPSSTLDMKWLRAMSPDDKDSDPRGSFHVDNVFMGRGSKRLTTAWVPFCDVPIELGGLVTLQGSSSLPGFQRLRETYGEIDVDRCATSIEETTSNPPVACDF